MFFDYNLIIRLEHVNMLSFLHYGFGYFDYEMDSCFLHSMLQFTFALIKDFLEIWINKIWGLIKYCSFFVGN